MGFAIRVRQDPPTHSVGKVPPARTKITLQGLKLCPVLPNKFTIEELEDPRGHQIRRNKCENRWNSPRPAVENVVPQSKWSSKWQKKPLLYSSNHNDVLRNWVPEKITPVYI
ncbi:uncharacterized protein LOC129757185 [Uranotaenia lowii]|uniref:uncharacterized protein LOC129757185 n=1 Tax=Uranotaenia lowii TaxID=190385 RepID=UPI00247AF803|nr:uncharacterized protein LOC129757185 [Uranotaenia lowii]